MKAHVKDKLLQMCQEHLMGLHKDLTDKMDQYISNSVVTIPSIDQLLAGSSANAVVDDDSVESPDHLPLKATPSTEIIPLIPMDIDE